MSDSDVDEFYDAQDVTPARNTNLITRCRPQHTQDGDVPLSSIEHEEQQLLDQKKRIEERRKQEEEEIQQKLQALERRKSQEREKQEIARKSQENEQRQKKLEGMRQFMSEDSTPLSSPVSQTAKPLNLLADLNKQYNVHDSYEEGISQYMQLSPEQQLEEKLEALSFELQRSSQSGNDQSRSDSPEDNSRSRHSLDNMLANSSHLVTLNKTVGSFESDCFEDAAEVTSPGVDKSGNRRASSLNSNLNKIDKSLQKVPSKQLDDLVCPDPVQPKSSSLPVQLSTYPSESISTQPVIYQEPDIIQSTKSLPRQQPVTSTPKVDKPCPSPEDLCANKPSASSGVPVAPPRKKKSSQSRESLCSEPEQRLSSEWPDEKTGELPDCFPPALDLSSAIQGNCHVTATDEVSAKGLEDTGLDILYETNTPEQSVASEQSEHDLDVLVMREDSVGEEATSNHHNVTNSSPLRLNRTKSKTLAGGSLLNMKHEKSSAAKVLSDKEILEQVMVTNLDTGEKLPLSLAEEKVPTSVNPLALHIMRRTKEYSSESPLQKGKEGPDKDTSEQGQTVKTINMPKKRGKKIKKFLSKSVRKIKSELKSVKDDMFHGENSSSDEDEFVDGRRMIKIKASHSHKGPYDFDLLVPVQNLAEDSNAAIWTMKFSHCGKLLVTGGQDNILRVWVLKSWYTYFDSMRQKYCEAANASSSQGETSADANEEEDSHAPFMPKPFCVNKGHTADLLDVSWSKNYFILSSSMDKTVRLWHVSRKECLCCFQHIDFVTAIAFHPKDDRYFLSGSLDGKLRLWSIPEKKVALWNEVSGQSKLITAANFCSDGKIAIGTYDGRCVLYTADHLDYHTQIHVRSTRGKNAKGGKITGVEPFPAENKILVTSNDSRIRLYDLRDKTLTCKYKGTINSSSRIKAVLNHDGRYIICGSEDGCIYIWKTQHDFYKFYSVRRDRNDFWEAVKAHVAVVTAAIFAPCPGLIIRPQFEFMDSDDKENSSGVRGEVIISADINGAIKVFINKFKPGSG